MSRTSYALLCMLGAALLAHCALAAPNRQFVGASPQSYYHGDNLKHLCLKEKKQTNCRYVGCQDLRTCGDDACDDPFDCETHKIGMSELTCCDKKDYGYSGDNYEKDLTDDDSINFDIAGDVGKCTWDMDILNDDGIELENGAIKVGTAWATCYLNGGAEKCGHPLCDDMVLSFQGGAYAMEGYAKGPVYTPEFDKVPGFDEEGCFSPGDKTELLDLLGLPNAPKPAPPAQAAGAPAPPKKGSVPAHKRSALARAISKSSLVKRLARHHKKGASSAKSGGPAGSESWTVGLAIVFSGQVEITSLGQRTDFTRGMMEYVPYFLDLNDSYPPPGSTATILEPHTYHLALVKNGVSAE